MVEHRGIEPLTSWGYAICGNYFEECVAETTMFDFNRMLYVVKEQVPIALDPQLD